MKAAVLGSPIAHSKSPCLHTAAYTALGLPWTYERYNVDADGLDAFMEAHHGDFKGLSLTMPLKQSAFKLAAVHDAASVATRACNTLVFDGQIRGYNTDVQGFIQALRSSGITSPSTVCILGTGATARSATVAMCESGVDELHVVGRHEDRVASFVAWASGFGVTVVGHTWDADPIDVDLTIATTPAGSTDHRTLPLRPGVLFDVVYEPWPTRYAQAWQDAGGVVIGGFDLLVQQAAEQVLLMTGTGRQMRATVVEAMYTACSG